MAKELPYFKFEPNAWENGNIQICSREAKGLFIEICSMYWSRLGELPYALALQKLCNGNTQLMQELCTNEIITNLDGQIIIDFLDEQLNEFQETSKKRANAANKRWSNANAMQVQSKSNAIREEKRREEEKREEKRREKTSTESDDLKSSLHNDLIKLFFDFYQEHKAIKYEVQNAKDGAATKNLVQKIKRQWKNRHNQDATEVEIKNSFMWLLHSIKKQNDWEWDNLTLAIINSKFNEILNKAKNGKQGAANNQDANRAAFTDYVMSRKDI